MELRLANCYGQAEEKMKIIPGVGIGKYFLKASFDELSEQEPFVQISEISFQNDDFIIRIDEQRKIDLLSLYNNTNYEYQGISLDATFAQVISTGRVLLFDDFDWNFYLKETEGIGLETVNKHLFLPDTLKSKIGMITVFEVDTMWKKFINSFEEIDKDKLKEIIKTK